MNEIIWVNWNLPIVRFTFKVRATGLSYCLNQWNGNIFFLLKSYKILNANQTFMDGADKVTEKTALSSNTNKIMVEQILKNYLQLVFVKKNLSRVINFTWNQSNNHLKGFPEDWRMWKS